MSRPAKTKADREALDAFAKTAIGATLLADLDELRELNRRSEEAASARVAENQKREEFNRCVDEALQAERQAQEDLGITALPSSDADAYVVPAYSAQAPILINTQAHPQVLISAALARADRCKAVAHSLECSELGGDTDTAFALARMIEEVVDILMIVSTHDGVIDALLPSAGATAKGGA